MRHRAEYATALLLEVLGAAGILLVAARPWQTITTVRSRPFAPDVVAVSGRTLDAAPTALALVGLAGVVAVLATTGVLRRCVGGLVAVAGAVAAWRSAGSSRAVSAARADALVRAKHQVLTGAQLVSRQIDDHPGWAAVSVACSVLVLLAGALVAWRGARWGSMSARYDPPPSAAPGEDENARARADARLWTALERGEDPTREDPSEAH